ncbi:TIGR03862 family flavoprotein [Acinetobacter sp. HY1485]|uniref:TIGR03862 family flavoprotein n=1 Tax=Acinetobacter sp. HY1485 TaxID=2970918 RepID=UPI0022B951E7|nr:TIGR03862 family flavoprotein [Acinetobacter sp. HY1485]
MAKTVAIVGAGPAGLMAAEFLSQYNYEIHIFEQMPSAARKFLMAGKTGLNISHAEPLKQFIARYDQSAWLQAGIEQFNAKAIQAWMTGLGIESYVGSSGRIFPVEMKAAPLLRAWLKRLADTGVRFHYRHRCTALTRNTLTFEQQPSQCFDAIVLACGAVSWSRLGSDGAWQKWLKSSDIQPFMPSNAGVEYKWSEFMQPVFGQPLKRIEAWVDPHYKAQGDIVITHYGLESGVVYKLNRQLREQDMTLTLDLLPDLTIDDLVKKLKPNKKQSMANTWRKAGLDSAKANLIREIIAKEIWQHPEQLAQIIKQLKIELKCFRPIEEAISCAGGVRSDVLTKQLQLKSNPHVFCCGEMLNWDAPTGGYLLTACFSTGRTAAQGVHDYLKTK